MGMGGSCYTVYANLWNVDVEHWILVTNCQTDEKNHVQVVLKWCKHGVIVKTAVTSDICVCVYKQTVTIIEIYTSKCAVTKHLQSDSGMMHIYNN